MTEKVIEIKKQKKPLYAGLMISIVLGLVAIATLVKVNFRIVPDLPGLNLALIAGICTPIALAVALLGRMLLRNKPALVITARGIEDYSGPASLGFVPWSEISEVSKGTNSLKQKLLIIYLKNPAPYLERPGLMKQSIQQTHKTFGSPMVVTASRLDYDIDGLEQLIRARL